ncbi:hypothetical protein SAMN02745148_01249 [Modicisalibacter ilicicola DSM 19980]|uniref:Uncharacterized protein n=1 Tax=Modicisalibacter ilicicola DSM 19980 TaxID=1121942 RepID=A0A1M4WXY4_9GAMM|nr:hypothetical protein [Halomonas ilicicola]SHE86050.1 hypothetical protein SAMN02745148_01249 [Halomonas ilicicola DSM 19980]
MLHRIGAILAILASLWALIASGISLYLGTDVGLQNDPTEQTVAGLGWWEAGIALVALGVAAATLVAKSPYMGLALAAVGAIGVFISSSSNIAFMATVAVGGFMAFMGRRHARRHHGKELP